ncbi:hypothetical protein F4775DRAFT_545168 [Biscogniauxia sp. FL1348]|nr:hypothetical protein F4775DRAFT_545168 [Biscogniauxia sp. FL1348]
MSMSMPEHSKNVIIGRLVDGSLVCGIHDVPPLQRAPTSVFPLPQHPRGHRLWCQPSPLELASSLLMVVRVPPWYHRKGVCPAVRVKSFVMHVLPAHLSPLRIQHLTPLHHTHHHPCVSQYPYP